MPTRRPDANRVRAAETRSSLLAAAEERFAKLGYYATSTTDLAALTSVTRGALYHHFTDKPGLFVAVFRSVAEGLNRRAQATVADLSGDTWRQLVESLRAYLRLVAADVGLQRIMLIDGPAVLGWSLWRDMQAEYVLADTVTVIQMLMDEGIVDARPPQPLAGLLLAALNEAALSIAHGADPEQAGDALMTLVEGLRVPRSTCPAPALNTATSSVLEKSLMGETNPIDQLYGALSAGDISAARACFTPDAVLWHCFDGVAQDLDTAAEAWSAMIGSSVDRHVADVRRWTTPDVVVQQHVFAMRTVEGKSIAWAVCLVVRIEHGLISRLEEYIDRAGSFAPKEDPILTPGF